MSDNYNNYFGNGSNFWADNGGAPMSFDAQSAQPQYPQDGQTVYQYNDNVQGVQSQYQYAQPTYQYGSQTDMSYLNSYDPNRYNASMQSAYGQPVYGAPMQAESYNYTYGAPAQPNVSTNAAPKKKKITAIVIITIAVIAVLVTLSIILIHSIYSVPLDDVYGSDYTHEQSVKQPTYKGEKPSLTVRSIADDTQPCSAKDVYNKTYKSIVQIYAYDESVMEYEGVSYGSGFIISDDGYILTNAHVLTNSYCKYKVILFDDTEYDALLVAADSKDDIGILKIDAKNLHEVELGDSSVITMGDKVYTIGNPSGPELSNSFCEGIISGINRTVQIADVSDITYFQTDAGINPGNSGGPLLNEYGQVIGINTGKMVGSGYESLGFSIPIHQALPVIDDLFEYGYVKDRVRIGASFEDVSRFKAMLMRGETGVRIVKIDPDSDLNNTDVDEYDIITHVNDTKIDSIFDLQAILTEAKPYDKVNLRVLKVNEDDEIIGTVNTTITLLEYSSEF